MNASQHISALPDNPLRDDLLEEDKEYRYAYAEDFLNTYIATQIRVLRDERGMKQEDLAKAIGTKQSGISRLENVNYSNWKTETLKKIARAFDVRLRISFETFGSMLDEDATFSRDSLKRPKFEDDPAFVRESIPERGIEELFAELLNLLKAEQKKVVQFEPFLMRKQTGQDVGSEPIKEDDPIIRTARR